MYRSNTNIYAQIIDDTEGKTLVAASSKEIEGLGSNKVAAKAVGELIAKKAKEAKITDVVFDRGGYIYHGRVKELAEGAREGGLNFSERRTKQWQIAENPEIRTIRRESSASTAFPKRSRAAAS